MEPPTHYELLCVTPDATADDIRAAYRRLIRMYHPDVAGASGEAMTLRLNAAQRELLDPNRRARYDRVAIRVPAFAGRASVPPQFRPEWPVPEHPEPTRTAPPQPASSRQARARSASGRSAQARPVTWNPLRYGVWMGGMAMSIGALLVATGLIFVISYSAPVAISDPRIIPPVLVATAWLVAGLVRPPKLFVALLALGAALWPLSAVGIEPFAMLSARVPDGLLMLVTVAAAAAAGVRMSTPRAISQSDARAARRVTPAYAG